MPIAQSPDVLVGMRAGTPYPISMASGIRPIRPIRCGSPIVGGRGFLLLAKTRPRDLRKFRYEWEELTLRFAYTHCAIARWLSLHACVSLSSVKGVEVASSQSCCVVWVAFPQVNFTISRIRTSATSHSTKRLTSSTGNHSRTLLKING